MAKYIGYARYSSNNQREESIEDQNRTILDHFASLGIDVKQVRLIADKGITGTHENRPGYQEVMRLIEAGEVDILIVDDQSRLTREANIGVLLDKFRFHNVRFIAVADGVDTRQEGTEVNAQVKGLVNNLSNKSHGKRVRRGLVGRVLDGNSSAGDYPFGYASVWEDQQAAAQYRGHGPKPKREVQIDPEESRIVRWIFEMFTVLMYSLHRIARELNQAKAPQGSRSKARKGWSHARVKRTLNNPKYIGDWSWGKNKVVKFGGKRKYHPVNKGEEVGAIRPSLAIITAEQWRAAQQRFEKWKAITGQRPNKLGNSFKGINFRETPSNLLSGSLFCGTCGARLHYIRSRTTAYFQCTVCSRSGKSDRRTVVNQAKAEKAILDFLQEKLSLIPEWLDDVYKQVQDNIKSIIDRTPEERERLLQQRDKLTREADNLMANLGQQVSKLLQDRLVECESKLESVDKQLAELDARAHRAVKLHGKDEVTGRLKDLLPIFTEEPIKGALLLQKFIGKVKAFDMIFPGKKRGYSRLEFRFDPLKLMRSACPAIANMSVDMDTSAGEDVVLYAGGPTKLESLMPQIHAWVEEGVTFKEIGRRTGMSVCSTTMYYKRWRKSIAEEERRTSKQGGDDEVDKSV